MWQADQTTTRLTAELQTATADLARSRRAAEEADRGAFERSVLLEAAVDTHRALAESRLGELEALRQMSQEQLQALEDERVTLQSRCEALSSALAAETAKAEEMRGTLHPQIEEWKVKAAAVEAQLQAKEREWGTARLGLTTEAELYRAKLFQERELGLSRERRQYEEATRLAHLVDALQASEGTLQAELERTKEELLQSQLQLQLASQQGALQIQSLNEKLTEAAARLEDARLEAEAARQADTERHSAELESVRAELRTMTIRRERTKGKKRAARAEAGNARKALEGCKEAAAFAAAQASAQIDGLRVELLGYQEGTQRLEAELRKNHNFRLLAQENDLLTCDIEALRNQNVRLTKECDDQRAEIQRLTEEAIKARDDGIAIGRQRVEPLERERRIAAPLMAELIAALQRHGLAGTLRREIDVYQQTARAFILPPTSASKRPTIGPAASLTAATPFPSAPAALTTRL